MRSKARSVILLSPLFLTGMRESLLCAGRALRSRAAQPVAVSGIVSGSRDIGLMQDGQKRWHRVKRRCGYRQAGG